MSHLNQQDCSPSEDTYFFPEDTQEKRKVKFRELGAKSATMYLTLKKQATSGILAFKDGIKSSVQHYINSETEEALKKQEERLKKRYVTWVVSSSIASFILGNICMFFIR
ncbi:TPA: hypothetical protein R4327_002049 [Pasteurella multocida]|uniref:hypothetical protein n=1 Tax=Pasteurella multocida TaxID=747 RepID=UPI002020E1FD|nr:hypothetical protein [Pasteurella multocida]MCL7827643.1 hypothetical protein [Pasteurella multocida]HDR1436371.1 hypothetical protein [Pasteurella multocida]HDR1793949.1 hypothetical protein [Pasteurella multocida]HDR1868199.1 hypothetical protein [Pasteurella multocida]HED4417514.1 hypothetical protein [Pasteurella multocida]